MKFAMVGPYALDINKIVGGVEAVIVYLIEGLKQIDDLDIHIISCRKKITEEKIVEKEKIKIHYLPSQNRFCNITLNFMEKYRIRKKIKQIKPEIIHFQDHPNYVYISSKPYCATVTTVHGILYKEVKIRKGILNWIRKFLIIYIERICLKREKLSFLLIKN